MDVKERAVVMAMVDKKVKHDKKEAQRMKNQRAKKPRRR
jgi:hypothetical protein